MPSDRKFDRFLPFKIMKLITALIASGFLSLSSAFCQQPVNPQISDAELASARKLVLSTVFGGSNELVRRWTSVPLAATLGASNEEQTMFLDVISEINDVLQNSPMKVSAAPTSTKISSGKIPDVGAAIRIYFCKASQMPSLCQLQHITYTNRVMNEWEFWNEDHSLKSVIAMIPRDRYTPDQLRCVTMRTMYFALGFRGFSDGSFPTAFSKNWPSKFQPLDRQTIRFFYSYVSPGMNYDQVRNEINVHWGDVASMFPVR